MGLRLAVVSNANGTVRSLWDGQPPPRVDLVFDSLGGGVEKPDPRFFEPALARMEARAKTTVHVGTSTMRT